MMVSTPHPSGLIISSKSLKAESMSPQWTHASKTAFMAMVLSFPYRRLATSISSIIYTNKIIINNNNNNGYSATEETYSTAECCKIRIKDLRELSAASKVDNAGGEAPEIELVR